MILPKEPLRILVVDDSTLYRRMVTDILVTIPDVLVVGTAPNGTAALARTKILHPDLLILDIEMPEMNGLEVLRYIKNHHLAVSVVILSSHTQHGSDMTLKALELGAFDFIPKPLTGDIVENKHRIREALAPMLAAYYQRRVQQPLPRPLVGETQPTPTVGQASTRLLKITPATCRPKIVVIGISTGGPQALAKIMPDLPSDIGLPIVIVQHMPALFTKTLAERLDKKCALHVKEAEDNEVITANTIYLAPGGKQMKIDGDGTGRKKIIITDDLPENCCKPSVDYLFRSVADQYGCHAVGIIMTGMGSDGLFGLRLMKRQGATVFAQDEASCVVYGMPRGPIEAGIVDLVVPLDNMADAICRAAKFAWSRENTTGVETSG
jgi:two-component system chemotaxis response regulator CheB